MLYLLYKLIAIILIAPVMMIVQPLRGQLNSLHQAVADFFWLAPLVVVPGLMIAASVVFSCEGWILGRVVHWGHKVLVVLSSGVLYALLTGIITYIVMLGKVSWSYYSIIPVGKSFVVPTTAIGVFGFWLPTIVCAVYAIRAKRPRWWVNAILGFTVLTLGVWLWILFGTLVNAGTD